MIRRAVPAALGIAIATTASAHPGNHTHMSLLDVVQHYAEPDHLALLALTVIVGVLAYRWGRRIEAKAHAKQQPKNGRRS